jgi:DNA-directed RNA polymerase subunit RPC12/RpoP
VSSVRAFLRHCPSCGRRFEIRLVSKRLVGSEDLTGDEKRVEAPGFGIAAIPIPVEEHVTSIVDVEEFQYAYRCKHCGHQWSEVREKLRDFDTPKGYTGD